MASCFANVDNPGWSQSFSAVVCHAVLRWPRFFFPLASRWMLSGSCCSPSSLNRICFHLLCISSSSALLNLLLAYSVFMCFSIPIIKLSVPASRLCFPVSLYVFFRVQIQFSPTCGLCQQVCPQTLTWLPFSLLGKD